MKGLEHVGDIKEDEIDAMFATNVIGLIAMTQLLVRGKSIYVLLSTIIPNISY